MVAAASLIGLPVAGYAFETEEEHVEIHEYNNPPPPAVIEEHREIEVQRPRAYDAPPLSESEQRHINRELKHAKKRELKQEDHEIHHEMRSLDAD